MGAFSMELRGLMAGVAAFEAEKQAEYDRMNRFEIQRRAERQKRTEAENKKLEPKILKFVEKSAETSIPQVALAVGLGKTRAAEILNRLAERGKVDKLVNKRGKSIWRISKQS